MHSFFFYEKDAIGKHREDIFIEKIHNKNNNDLIDC
jgi:hypothetical protein